MNTVGNQSRQLPFGIFAMLKWYHPVAVPPPEEKTGQRIMIPQSPLTKVILKHSRIYLRKKYASKPPHRRTVNQLVLITAGIQLKGMIEVGKSITLRSSVTCIFLLS